MNNNAMNLNEPDTPDSRMTAFIHNIKQFDQNIQVPKGVTRETLLDRLRDILREFGDVEQIESKKYGMISRDDYFYRLRDELEQYLNQKYGRNQEHPEQAAAKRDQSIVADVHFRLEDYIPEPIAPRIGPRNVYGGRRLRRMMRKTRKPRKGRKGRKTRSRST